MLYPERAGKRKVCRECGTRLAKRGYLLCRGDCCMSRKDIKLAKLSKNHTPGITLDEQWRGPGCFGLRYATVGELNDAGWNVTSRSRKRCVDDEEQGNQWDNTIRAMEG